jgi:hypothetical protein
VAIGALVEIGAAERVKRARKGFEQRSQFRKATPFGVRDCPLQPLFDSHTHLVIWSFGHLVIDWSIEKSMTR